MSKEISKCMVWCDFCQKNIELEYTSVEEAFRWYRDHMNKMHKGEIIK